MAVCKGLKVEVRRVLGGRAARRRQWPENGAGMRGQGSAAGRQGGRGPGKGKDRGNQIVLEALCMVKV